MTKQQIDAVLAFIPHTGTPAAYRVGVLMSNGDRFAGTAYAANSQGLMRIDTDRTADAHLSKARATVWLNTDAIIAITSDGVIPAPV